MSLPPLRAGDKTVGQDVFLVHRRRTKSSWSGSARHPEEFRRVEISVCWLSTLNPPPCIFSAMPDGLANASRPHSKLRTRSPLSGKLITENPPLVPASARNRLLFTRMHSHAGAQKSSGAFFRVLDRERCRKRPGRVRIALRASQGVRPRTLMLNGGDIQFR